MPDEYIKREAALMKLMQDGCSAKNLQSISDIARRRRCGGGARKMETGTFKLVLHRLQ